MNGKKAKAARQAAQSVGAPKSAARSSSFWTSWKGGLVALGVLAIIAASFVLPDVLSTKTTSAGASTRWHSAPSRARDSPSGSSVPSFSEQDLQSGEPITSTSVYGRKTLLFFSEGVMCQACFEQIKGLEQFGSELERAESSSSPSRPTRRTTFARPSRTTASRRR